MKIVSYEQRLAKIKKLGDEDIQLRRAKQYVRRLILKKKAAPSLAEKIELESAVKDAQAVLRKLRVNIFNIEDMLINKLDVSNGKFSF